MIGWRKRSDREAAQVQISSERLGHTRRWPDAVGRSVSRTIRLTVFWIFLIDVLLVIVFGILSPGHAFIGVANIRDLLLDSSEIVLLSVGEAILLSAAQLDISVGANLVLSSAVGAEVMIHLSGNPSQVAAGDYPHLAVGVILGVLACLVTGIAFGSVNGMLVSYVKINPLIVTLATTGIGTGIADLLTNGFNVPYIPPIIQSGFGSKTVGPVPVPALLVALVCLLLWAVMTKSRFGVHTRAIGSSPATARRSGLPVQVHIMILFMIMGLLAGLAGVIDIARYATTDVGGHTTDGLSAIAGAVIGGTSIFGGVISVGGAVIGALLAVIVDVGLVIMNIPSFYQLIVVGLILLGAVAIDQHRRRRRNAS